MRKLDIYVFCGQQGDAANAQAYYDRLEDGQAYNKVLEDDQHVKVAVRWPRNIVK